MFINILTVFFSERRLKSISLQTLVSYFIELKIDWYASCVIANNQFVIEAIANLEVY